MDWLAVSERREHLVWPQHSLVRMLRDHSVEDSSIHIASRQDFGKVSQPNCIPAPDNEPDLQVRKAD